MLPAKVAAVRFEVVTPYGVAYRGTSTDDVGSWNSGYRAVYQLSFSGVRTPGQYQVKVLSPASAVSPAFTIGDGAQLYGQLVDNAVQYFTSERDGPDVDSAVLGRQPANLTDESASVYADPAYDSNDNLLGTFKKIGGPVDVSGGWFDAGGGYEKFAYTASYADALMLIAARALSNEQGTGSYAMLQPEATFGLQWITKLWNPARKVLYAQVGIGNGNASNTIQGGYGLGLEVLWHALRAEDGRGRDTALAGYLTSHFGVELVEETTLGIHKGKIGDDDLTNLAPLLLRASDEGDPVARTVVNRLADEISVMAITAMRRLGLTVLATPVILGGGIMTARNAPLMDSILRQLAEAAPAAVVRVIDVPPVAGAALLGLDHVNAGAAAASRLRAAYDVPRSR